MQTHYTNESTSLDIIDLGRKAQLNDTCWPCVTPFSLDQDDDTLQA